MKKSIVMFIVAALCLVGVRAQSGAETCLSVKAGAHYSSLIPFYGLLNGRSTLSALIKFDPSAASYLFESSDPQGHLCTVSWNKLYGTTRCGYDPHADSDRFVWRRAGSCVLFSGAYSTGEKPECDEAELIELAAYAYDKGQKPFENQGRLLKEFNTKVRIGEYYGYKITIYPTSTVYELSTRDGELLEQVSIEHRDCGSTALIGSLQKFYFGGQCPAPQAVKACYIE